MPVFTLNQHVNTANADVNLSQTYSGSSAVSVSDAIAGSSTTQIVIAIDVSAVKGFMVTTSVAATLKTNSSGSPDDTITLKANVPYVWNTDSYDTFLLTTDVTSIYFVVAGATAGTARIEVVSDATP